MRRWLILFFFLLMSPTYAIPNPASVYCIHHGGELKIMHETAGDVGVCIFQDKSYCEEWSYFRGTCKPSEYFLPEKRKGTSYCLTHLDNKNLLIYLCKN